MLQVEENILVNSCPLALTLYKYAKAGLKARIASVEDDSRIVTS
jgi:hypothetical protein